MRCLLHCLSLACLVTLTLALTKKIVDTTYGQVEGKIFSLHHGKHIARWHSIPYAKPLTPERRFLPPEKPDSWEGVKKCHRLPPACPQWPGGLIWITQPLFGNYQEDCLYLNIYAPDKPSSDPDGYPVMVYIHGGGYISSAAVQYPGHFLAGWDVVVVVINYRIAAHGFMSTGDDVVPGNMGLQDQIMALEYVRDNIHNFGGNKNKVTAFGQSAGAASSSLLLISPKAKDLVHQVILESGNDQAAWAINEEAQDPHEYTKVVAKQYGCPTDDSAEMMDCLRTKDEIELGSNGFSCKPGYFCQGFAPVVDGPGGVLPEDPLVLRRKGEFAHAKVMAGHCKDDGSAYTAMLIPETMSGGFNRTELRYYLKTRLMDMFLPLAPDKEEEAMTALEWYYAQWPHTDDRDRNRDSLNVLITDFGWGAPSDVSSKSTVRHGDDVYYYVLGYRTTKADMFVPQWMGVPHNGELPYVVGWPHLQLNQEIRDDSGVWIDFIRWDDEDIEWTDYVQELWTNFAKYGNPTPKPVKTPNGNPDTVWPKYDLDDFKYLYMDRKTEVRTEYRARNTAFWHLYFPYLTDYRIYPAGQPLIPAPEANDTWILYGQDSVKQDWKADFGPDEDTAKGFDTGKFQAAFHAFFKNWADMGLQAAGKAFFMEK